MSAELFVWLSATNVERILSPHELLNGSSRSLNALLEEAQPFIELLVELVVEQILLSNQDVDVLYISTLLLPVYRLVLRFNVREIHGGF